MSKWLTIIITTIYGLLLWVGGFLRDDVFEAQVLQALGYLILLGAVLYGKIDSKDGRE